MSLNGMGSYGHLPRIQETSLVIYCILVSFCIPVSYCIPGERLWSESHFRLVHESQKAKVCHNGKNDRPSLRHAIEQIVTFLLDSFSLAIKVSEDLFDQISI